MPSAGEILESLSYISQAYSFYAIVWHLIIVIFFVSLIKFKPTNRLFSSLLSLPLFSVSIFAWLTENPFNGTVFLIFALLLLFFGILNSKETISSGPLWSVITGSVIVIFGLIYPHFLENGAFFSYLYSAPTCLIPCPTLSLVIGLSIIFNGFRSRKWSVSLLIIGIFYGIFGVFRLGVTLDIFLLFADSILLITIVKMER